MALPGAARPWWRPEGVHHLMTFAEMTGAHVYVVHPSCEESLHEADARRRTRGACLGGDAHSILAPRPQSNAEKPDFESAKAVMSPPLRDKKNQEALWNGLRQRFVSIARDRSRAPFDFAPQKKKKDYGS